MKDSKPQLISASVAERHLVKDFCRCDSFNKSELHRAIFLYFLAVSTSVHTGSVKMFPMRMTSASRPVSTVRLVSDLGGSTSSPLACAMLLCLLDTCTPVGSATPTASPRPKLSRTLEIRASNEGSRRFHNHGEGPYLGLLLVESIYWHFHI